MVLYESLMKAMSLHHSERRTKTLTYKLLESKHKTAVQYWQSDGTAWPELQKVSLSILNVSIKCSLTEKLLGTFIRSYFWAHSFEATQVPLSQICWEAGLHQDKLSSTWQ